MRIRQVSLHSLKAFAKDGLFECASTYKLKIDRHDVLDKKTNVKSGITIHRSEGLLDYYHVDV